MTRPSSRIWENGRCLIICLSAIMTTGLAGGHDEPIENCVPTGLEGKEVENAELVGSGSGHCPLFTQYGGAAAACQSPAAELFPRQAPQQAACIQAQPLAQRHLANERTVYAPGVLHLSGLQAMAAVGGDAQRLAQPCERRLAAEKLLCA